MSFPRLVGEPTYHTYCIANVWPRIAQENQTPNHLFVQLDVNQGWRIFCKKFRVYLHRRTYCLIVIPKAFKVLALKILKGYFCWEMKTLVKPQSPYNNVEALSLSSQTHNPTSVVSTFLDDSLVIIKSSTYRINMKCHILAILSENMKINIKSTSCFEKLFIR